MRIYSFLISVMSFLMSVLSFNQFINNRKTLVNYVTKGTMKYMKSYVKLEDLQQQTLLSYYKYKDSIIYPLHVNSSLIKKMFKETMQYSHQQRKHQIKTTKLHDYYSSLYSYEEELIEFIDSKISLNCFLEKCNLTSDEIITISMLINNKTLDEIRNYHKYTFQGFKKHINKIKRKTRDIKLDATEPFF